MAAKRAGRTVKVSVSLDVDDVAVLRRRARESYGGSLSAAFSEAARWIRQREARRHLVDLLAGPMLTPDMAGAIDAEQAAGSTPGTAEDQAPNLRRMTGLTFHTGALIAFERRRPRMHGIGRGAWRHCVHGRCRRLERLRRHFPGVRVLGV